VSATPSFNRYEHALKYSVINDGLFMLGVTKFKEENNISTCEQFQFGDGLSHSISFDFWTYPSYDVEG
jgi:hypothetical protein